MEIDIAMLSRLGGRERNEDACGYWRDGGPVCCVLSDGAGGHGGGDVASRLAVDQVLERFESEPQCTPQRVRSLIEMANHAVISGQARESGLWDMRATLVVLALDPDASTAVWGHVGDSRLYCFRNGYLHARTKDHSLIQSMIDAGFADPARIAGPDRSVLIASLGGDEGFRPDVLEQPFGVSSGDAFLLCSDGFWENVTDRSMEAALQRAASPRDWIDQMERLVHDASRPSQDNYTALAVWCGAMDFTTRAPSFHG